METEIGRQRGRPTGRLRRKRLRARTQPGAGIRRQADTDAGRHRTPQALTERKVEAGRRWQRQKPTGFQTGRRTDRKREASSPRRTDRQAARGKLRQLESGRQTDRDAQKERQTE